jgi:hypothetical protein
VASVASTFAGCCDGVVLPSSVLLDERDDTLASALRSELLLGRSADVVPL